MDHTRLMEKYLGRKSTITGCDTLQKVIYSGERVSMLLSLQSKDDQESLEVGLFSQARVEPLSVND